MKRTIVLMCILLNLLCLASFADETGLVAWWTLDSVSDNKVFERIGDTADPISGNFRQVDGVSDRAIRFDGLTTQIVRESAKAPKFGHAFTIEAYIALGAYPWNWCPIVSQSQEQKSGYCFGIDPQGHVGLRLAVDANWVECKSPDLPGQKVGLELGKWYHVAGVFNADSGITIYIDSKAVANARVRGQVDYAPAVDLVVGRNHTKMAPSHPVREWATFPSWYSFDGIIDEIKIHNQALNAQEIKAASELGHPKQPDIPERKFPTVPDTGRFAAYYTKLRYYDEWDALWRTGDHSDLVVTFDEHPIKVMFWRGSRYSACWVTENGKWMADQSREVGSNWNLKRGPATDLPTGCCEHMSDTQCRHSHVRLIENNDARVVVHWRYALIDVLYRQAEVDPVTGWGLWGDELYTIYPDGVGVRHVLPGRGGWQETIFFNEPGTRPEDNCRLEAITLVNLKGQSKTYSWEHGYPKFDLDEPLIQMTNLKSKYKPFLIFRPGSGMKVFNVEVRPEYSHFPWWNHWPVAQVASDGRHAQAADRAAHSSLAWGRPKGDAALYGLTAKPAVEMLSLAKSWIYPPAVIVHETDTGAKITNVRYDYKQRAYVFEIARSGGAVEFTLAASGDSPVFNPAFVIRNWGEADAALTINGKDVPRGTDLRFGHRPTFDGTDLVVWVKTESKQPIKIVLTPVQQ